MNFSLFLNGFSNMPRYELFFLFFCIYHVWGIIQLLKLVGLCLPSCLEVSLICFQIFFCSIISPTSSFGTSLQVYYTEYVSLLDIFFIPSLVSFCGSICIVTIDLLLNSPILILKYRFFFFILRFMFCLPLRQPSEFFDDDFHQTGIFFFLC